MQHFLFLLASFVIALVHASNPYEALGVTKSSSQDDIRKSYRKLCLKYHPDKNVGSSQKEREQCEKAFKAVQAAYELIGDETSRKQYDSSSLFSSSIGTSSRSYNYGGKDHDTHTAYEQDADELFRRFFSARNNPYSRYPSQHRRPFYVNGIDVSHLFNPMMNGSSRRYGNYGHERSSHYSNHEMEQLDEDYPKSIFVEKVTVPLQELYSGVSRKEFVLKDNIYDRYRAAIRGGLAKNAAIQGLLASTPLLLRASWPVSLLSFLITFHLSLPQPTRRFYSTKIKRGWKGGTKLKFSLEPKINVVFIIKEGKHDMYERDGDDLKTSVTIRKLKAKRGCNVVLKALGEHEPPVIVKLKPGQVTSDRQVVKVKGKGWPKKGGGGKGDLLLSIRLK